MLVPALSSLIYHVFIKLVTNLINFRIEDKFLKEFEEILFRLN